MENRVSITISEGIADVRLVRAEKMNALDAEMFEALVAATDRLSRESAHMGLQIFRKQRCGVGGSSRCR